jgi:small nuclear ribonucleoprotein (snRNP)-like protein
MSVIGRRFNTEVSALLDRTVMVVTIDGKAYNGTLVGFNNDNLSLCLADVKDPEGNTLSKLILSGNIVGKIFSAEKPFDLKKLAERLNKVFPKMVKLYEKERFIWVMDRVKVTEKGIIEGTGPSAERIQRVYSLFIQDMKNE